MSEISSRAVFLSYAREDADAARRIAEALRSSGIEVWFDQNELRGGDTWDAKIRKQINDCTLFLPVISQHTQERNKGYFRLEWRLAVEQTHLMLEGVPFLAPVVVDDTPESGAAVPPEFLRVQWTRLPGALPSPQFVTQVRILLEGPQKSVGRDRLIPPHASAPRQAGSGDPALQKSPTIPGWMWGVLAGVLLVVAVGIAMLRQPEPVTPPKVAGPEAKTQKPEPSRPAPVADKSIAVLPFENMSEEKDASAFFADGVQEDILTNLSFIRELRVVSRTSVMQYRGTKKTIGQVAAELGVAYVLEGSVRRVGNKVRVTGQLIHAATDEHVWAKAYDRDITDVFAIQAELSQAIAGALQAAISPAEKTLVERRPTNNPDAYALYVKARSAYQTGTITNLSTTLGWLLDAVQLDPGFAAAWAQLAAIQASEHFNENDVSAATLQKAKAAIETAVRLAPDDPVVIEMQGDYFYYGYRDFPRAVAQYERLLTLRPNSAEAYGSLGLIYRRQARWHDAEVNLRKAVELDPQAGRYWGALTIHLVNGRRFEDAAAALVRNPGSAAGDTQLGYYSVLIPYAAHGSAPEVDAWFARLKPRPGEEHAVIDLRKNWARTHGDFAGAIQLDAQQPFYEGDPLPRWQEDFSAAGDYLGSGDLPAARARYEKLVPELKSQLEKQPTSYPLWSSLGFAAAVIGDREQALEVASKLAGELALKDDAVEGPNRRTSRAQILAWIGRKDEALAELARLFQTPYGALVAGVRYDLGWLPLHGDPRFEALLADPKNNEPLF